MRCQTDQTLLGSGLLSDPTNRTGKTRKNGEIRMENGDILIIRIWEHKTKKKDMINVINKRFSSFLIVHSPSTNN